MPYSKIGSGDSETSSLYPVCRSDGLVTVWRSFHVYLIFVFVHVCRKADAIQIRDTIFLHVWILLINQLRWLTNKTESFYYNQTKF